MLLISLTHMVGEGENDRSVYARAVCIIMTVVRVNVSAVHFANWAD